MCFHPVAKLLMHIQMSYLMNIGEQKHVGVQIVIEGDAGNMTGAKSKITYLGHPVLPQRKAEIITFKQLQAISGRWGRNTMLEKFFYSFDGVKIKKALET